MAQHKQQEQAAELRLRGEQAYNLGQFETALRLYDQALRLDPANARLWYDKGNVFRNWHRQLPGPASPRFAEAIPCYRRAISLDAQYADAWGNMGVAFGALNDHAQALACFKKALEIQPNDTHWLQMKTVAQRKMAQPPA